MIEVPVYNMAGELVEKKSVDEAELGGEIARQVLRQAIIAHEANQRAGTASTKTRAELSYSNRKPWRQKHTGRARAGTRASPLWRGGGVVFGPKPRDYSQKLNKKMRRKAVASAILAKLQAGQVKVVDDLRLPQAKTAEVVGMLKALGVERTFLLVVPEHDPVVWRCTRNIPGSAVMTAAELNAYEVLRARDVVFAGDAFERTMRINSRSAEPGTPGDEDSPAESE